jgi:hypothetical protein
MGTTRFVRRIGLYGGFCNVFRTDGNLGGALDNQASSIETW